VIEDRVGELRVRVRTDLPEAGDLRQRAEQIARLTLERCAVLLDERNPERIVLIRRLPLRWRFDEAALDEAATVEELASAAADAIERAAVPVRLDVQPDDADAVLFDDEAHLRAAYLVAVARSRPAWFHEAIAEEGDALAALAAPQQRVTAHAVLIRLAAAGLLGEVLAAQPSEAVAVLAAALGFMARATARQPAIDDSAAFTASEPAGLLADIIAQWPAVKAPAHAIGLRIHAAALLDVAPDAPAAVALAEAAARILAEPAVAPLAAAPRPERRNIGFWDDTAPAEQAAFTTPPTTPQADGDAIVTRCAGLLYLLDRIQELGLAEALWTACLPEGAVLAAAAAALLGPASHDDPAAALFGGVDEVAACPEVTDEQHAEIAAATCAALAEALPRRGLADIPPVVVSLAERAGVRLLVAAAEGSPFALFAWPAISAASIESGLRALLNAWPQRGAIGAPPALAALDTSGRLRPLQDLAVVPLLLPDASSAAASALLALAIGAPSYLFAARAGTEPATAASFVTEHLAHAGLIRLDADRMTVHLDIDDIDVAARGAGLDRDPGWVPWLQREVQFVFEERRPHAVPPSAPSP
jgi:hypothetical protein